MEGGDWRPGSEEAEEGDEEGQGLAADNVHSTDESLRCILVVQVLYIYETPRDYDTSIQNDGYRPRYRSPIVFKINFIPLIYL